MSRIRNQRQETIRTLVRTRAIHTQYELIDHLKKAGISCTQATISRDITEMGLHKFPAGTYVLPEDLHLQRMVSELVVSFDSVDNFVVIKTKPGSAQGIAAAIDDADLEGIMGTVPGNDTIFIMTQDKKASHQLCSLLKRLIAIN